MKNQKYSYITSFICIAAMIGSIFWASMYQHENEYLWRENTRLRCDSVALDVQLRHFARWHWQLDNGTKHSIDSMIKADKRERVIKHIAEPK